MRRRESLAAAGVAALAAQTESVWCTSTSWSIFVGADQIRPGRYDRDEVFRIALPNLEELRRFGCSTARRITRAGTRSCWPDFRPRQTSRSGRTPACMAQQIISTCRDLRGPKRPRNSRKVGWRRRARTAAAAHRDRRPPGPLDELYRKLIRAAAITSRETD